MTNSQEPGWCGTCTAGSIIYAPDGRTLIEGVPCGEPAIDYLFPGLTRWCEKHVPLEFRPRLTCPTCDGRGKVLPAVVYQ